MNVKQKEYVLKRLNKVEGQIRGVNKMVTDDRYCIDILTQARAVVSAIRKVEDLIFKQRIHNCISSSMRSQNEGYKTEEINEVMDMLSKFRRMK